MQITEERRADTSGAAEGIGERCVNSIRAAMSSANENASGRTSASLGYKEDNYNLLVFADGEHAPFRTTQWGNKPTPKGGNGFLPQIIQWVKDKRLSVDVKPTETLEQAQSRAGRAIYAKIWREGTERYKSPRQDIYTPALDAAIDEFTNKVAGAVVKMLMK